MPPVTARATPIHMACNRSAVGPPGKTSARALPKTIHSAFGMPAWGTISVAEPCRISSRVDGTPLRHSRRHRFGEPRLCLCVLHDPRLVGVRTDPPHESVTMVMKGSLPSPPERMRLPTSEFVVRRTPQPRTTTMATFRPVTGIVRMAPWHRAGSTTEDGLGDDGSPVLDRCSKIGLIGRLTSRRFRGRSIAPSPSVRSARAAPAVRRCRRRWHAPA